jgi:hypothetical protein
VLDARLVAKSTKNFRSHDALASMKRHPRSHFPDEAGQASRLAAAVAAGTYKQE